MSLHYEVIRALGCASLAELHFVKVRNLRTIADEHWIPACPDRLPGLPKVTGTVTV